MVSRLLLCLAIAFPAFAAEVSGVKFEEALQPAGLVLNGAGVRKRFIFAEVYAMGLYLPKKTREAQEAMSMPGAKRVAIHMLRDVGAEQFTEALVDGIRQNHSEAEAKALEPRLQQLAAIMAQLKEAKKGMAIALDLDGGRTQVLVDGKPQGAPIPGEDFYVALLRIWLGPNPVQEDLRAALLGG
ncbi:MAG TPA: chalcone isomerase family protein [Burkholderiales bacterium]|nr:chalcone isomerase family protein [Burkholderiales bacterium]